MPAGVVLYAPEYSFWNAFKVKYKDRKKTSINFSVVLLFTLNTFRVLHSYVYI